jgi:hypothetical protein
MSKKAIVSRWGDDELDDSQYITIPGFVLRNYHKFVHDGQRVGLTPDEFQAFVHIMSFKYDVVGSEAAPSLQTVAEQCGKHVSSLRRSVKRLKEKSALKVDDRPGKPSAYDFGELVRQCREFEQACKESVNATPSADANTTPSADASIPLAQTLAEELNLEGKSKKTGEPGGADGGNKKPKRQRSQKQLALDGMKNAIADAFGLDHSTVTSSKWSEFGRAGKELLEVGAGPADMAPLHAHCVAQGWSDFTSIAMAKAWPKYVKARTPTQNVKSTTRAQETRALLNGVQS